MKPIQQVYVLTLEVYVAAPQSFVARLIDEISRTYFVLVRILDCFHFVLYITMYRENGL